MFKIPEKYFYNNIFEKYSALIIITNYPTQISEIGKPKKHSKRTWKVVKEITGKQKAKSNLPSRIIKVGKTTIQNSQNTAKEFNNFFTSLRPKLVKKFQTLKKNFKNF